MEILKTIMNPFTTATSLGVALRYISAIVGGVVTILGVLGALSPAQQEAITTAMPTLLTAFGAIVMAGVPLYAMFTKSSSNKAAEVAKQIDALVPPTAVVEVKTPVGVPDIRVGPKP